MNCRILSSLLFLEFIISSCTQASSKTKSNNRLFNKETSLNVYTILNTSGSKRSTARFKTIKKWKIERVTNKQYGIINMLWQKTKVFIDRDYSNLTCKATTIDMTPEIQRQVASEHKTLKSTLQGKQASTPSYIEFYYLEQGDDRIKRKQPSNKKIQKVKNGNKTSAGHSNNRRTSYPIPSLFKIHIGTISRKHVSQPTKSYHKVGQGKINSKIRSGKPRNFRAQKPTNIITKGTPANAVSKERMKKGYTGIKNSYRKEFVVGTTSVIKRLLVLARTSTAYDKVKFFEIYDNNTPKWSNYIHNNFSDMIYVNDNKEKINNYNNVQLLHDINDNTGYQQDKNKTRYVKKHIQNLLSNEENVSNEIKSTKYFTKPDLKISSASSKLAAFPKNLTNCSRLATWTEFPFVAVYIYEPSQVRCDAAGISPHWVVAAASCLSRYRKETLRGGGLSAFVTFCGDNWRYPQMISYVKRTLIHPKYHPKDKSGHLYNAGLVQVVNSMADTCSGWAPASLMSHQFATDEKGSIGTAVGWGLDRYDESFATTDVPRHPLTIYEGRVYSRSCPGSSEYSNAKSLYEEVVRNVYCLSLPPYLAEENDTVHGALLLIGGKLLALYLKEERRPWGVQSAQYASIWRLLPWLAETAREPDETFQFDL